MLLPLLMNNLLGSGIPPLFLGPSISDFSLAQGAAMTPRNYAPRFTELESQALTFTAIGAWPPGLSLSAAGELTGTPTTLGAYGPLQVRATDTDTDATDSNEFVITIAVIAGGTGDVGGGNLGGGDIGYPDVGSGDVSTPQGWLS